MSRGLTWSHNEIGALIDIWKDDYVNNLLKTTHKNNHVFKMFSERMRAMGFNRTADQCRTKVKALRLQFNKIKDKMRQSGSAGDEKEEFTWYDDLDIILGDRPTSSPKYIVESTDAGQEVNNVTYPGCSVDVESDKSGRFVTNKQKSHKPLFWHLSLE